MRIWNKHYNPHLRLVPASERAEPATMRRAAALNCGQIRGPVQLGFARSVEPVMPQEVTITRVAITTEADAEKKGTEMGRKYIIPYGLYRCEGHVSANLARKTTGFSQEGLELLWQAVLNMFEHDRSAARGKMAARELLRLVLGRVSANPASSAEQLPYF